MNLVKHNKNYYVLEKSGRIYKVDFVQSSLELIIDFSEKVDDSNDRGAKGFAFSKVDNTFAISYVNKLKQLKVDLYSYENDFLDYEFAENLYQFKMNMILFLGIMEAM